jgi:hypothetical protein
MKKYIKLNNLGQVSYVSEDGQVRIERTGKHPHYGYAHELKGTWWLVYVRDETLGCAPDYWVEMRSHFSFERAKRAARDWPRHR